MSNSNTDDPSDQSIIWQSYVGDKCRRCGKDSTKAAINSMGRILLYSCSDCISEFYKRNVYMLIKRKPFINES